MSAMDCAGSTICVWAPQEEGIVIKRMDSPWVLNDRSGSWLKVKPEYVKARTGARCPHAARRVNMLRVCLASCPYQKRSHALAQSAHVGMLLASYA